MGHSIGISGTPVPPGADTGTGLTAFSCTHCHDPHGTTAATGQSNGVNGFRNLKTIPQGSNETGGVALSANTRSYVGTSGSSNNWTADNADGDENAIWPVYATTATFQGASSESAATSGTVNSYGVGSSGNTNATDGIASWCAACHDEWHEDDAAGGSTNEVNSGEDWRRHPVDNVLEDDDTESGAGVNVVDTSKYTTAGDAGLPLASSSDAPLVAYLVPGEEGKQRVFCLSCHFAHAGPYLDALRWDYLSSVGQGSQVGKSLASNEGCQLCHNR
jgi:hypothetical protein